MSGYLNGFGPINAHPAPESSQTSGLSMGKRLSGQIRSHGYQSHGSHWWNGDSPGILGTEIVGKHYAKRFSF